jgi:hypothetical protein
MGNTQTIPHGHPLKAALLMAAIAIGTCAAGAQTTATRPSSGVRVPCGVPTLTTMPPITPYSNASWPRSKWWLDHVLKTRDTVPCATNIETMRRRVAAGLQNPFDQILRQMDSLGLTRDQADSLATLNRSYSRARDSLGREISRRFIDLPPSFDIDAVWRDAQPSYESFVTRWGEWGTRAKAILTPGQLAKLPPVIALHLDAVCIRENLLRTLEGRTEVERAVEIANRRRATGCPW